MPDDVNDDSFDILRQTIAQCLNLSGPFEKPGINPDETQWQAARRQDKAAGISFTVPAKFLACGPPKKGPFHKPCPPQNPRGASGTTSGAQGGGRGSAASVREQRGPSENPRGISPARPSTSSGRGKSSAASFHVELGRPKGSLGNSQSIFPARASTSSGMTLASSDTSGASPGLPHARQVPLARAAEGEAPSTSRRTRDILTSYAHTLQCSSEQDPIPLGPNTAHKTCTWPEDREEDLMFCAAAAEVSPSASPAPVRKGTEAPSRGKVPTQKHNAEEQLAVKKVVEPPSRGKLTFKLGPGYFLQAAREFESSEEEQGSSPAPQKAAQEDNVEQLGRPSLVDVTSRGLLSGNTVEDSTEDLSKNKGPEAKKGGGKVAGKQKHLVLDIDNPETSTTSMQATEKAARQNSAGALQNWLDKVPCQKPPLKLIRAPKRIRMEETQVQPHPPATEPNREQPLCTERSREPERAQEAGEGTRGRPLQQTGVQILERVGRRPFHVAYDPPIPELCAQVRATKISKALLGWAACVLTKEPAGKK
nr:PREDICTED: uncharacterized protein LOC103282592 isoform X1 [Anolis carolinensis]|eukprot:XP_008123525.1 PREDICTED: uncharacterized protein LOC103282592 isoform X1 [Anolis carolinensis]